MNVETETRRSVAVHTSTSTTLKVTRTKDALVLAHGLGGEGEPFRRPEWCGDPITLPASIIGELRQALDALEDEG